MNKKRNWIIVTVMILIITNVLTFYCSSIIPAVLVPGNKVIVSKERYNKLKDVESLMGSNKELKSVFQEYNGVLKFEKLFQIKEQLEYNYDGKISDDTLLEGAIKGMTNSLNDPYTVFMNKKEYDSFNTETTGEYVGLGIQVEAKDNKIQVVSCFEDSPAKKAGIIAGDIIQKVNGTAYAGSDLEKAIAVMKGKEDTEVTVTFYRASKGSFDVKLKRQKIEMNTVKGEMLDSQIGYINISMFDSNTGTNFSKELKTLKNKNMKGLILDLRDNPGGSLETCIQVTSNFVKKNDVIVSTIDKYKKETKYKSDGGDAIGMPLVVLVDGGTASASEIFSGAIRDYKLGTLIGKKTFGKGIVQSMIPDDSDGTALKVTVAKYYTPSGENIHKKGINPDIDVDISEALKQNYDRSKDPQFSKALEVIKQKMK